MDNGISQSLNFHSNRGRFRDNFGGDVCGVVTIGDALPQHDCPATTASE